MSKGNLFLGMASGSIGDITMYRADGEQITRARNRHPRNPQTDLQLLQRVVLVTTQRAYSLFSAITDHSFQGKAKGTASQARFTALNVSMFRALLADTIAAISRGDTEEHFADSNYNLKDAFYPEFNPYIISEGTLTPFLVSFAGGRYSIPFSEDPETVTYAQGAAALGCQLGDQVTFCWTTIDDTDYTAALNGFNYARVILQPAEGDATTRLFNVTETNEITVNSPNPANQGSVGFAFGSSKLYFAPTAALAAAALPSNVPAAICAATVIKSRRLGDLWQRSTQQLVTRPYTIAEGNLAKDHGTDLLADAMYSYRTQSGSALYLNQATQ